MIRKITLLLILLIILTGCIRIDFISNIEAYYEKEPIAISYTLVYGYNVSCIGNKKYNIFCTLNAPSNLYENIIFLNWSDKKNVTEEIISGNRLVKWNVSGFGIGSHLFSITTKILASATIVNLSDWKDALTLEEIKTYHKDLIEQYCHNNSNETVTLIEPYNTTIFSIANSVRNSSNSNNTFILAKELFKWLKQNTDYKLHQTEGTQRASYTLLKKGGDCDDLTFLYISLCRAIDIPARFIKGYLINENGSNVVPHAWAEVFVGGDIGDNGWIPVECAGNSKNVKIEINQHFGIESAHHLRLYVDDGSNESINNSISRIGYKIVGKGEDINVQSFKIIRNYEIVEEGNLVIYKDGTREFVKTI
jgi:hypothetical protein